jgi:hypothetical protein
LLSYFQVEAPIHRPSFFLFFSLTIKDKTKISLTIKILHLGQGSFTRKVRTIFTLKIIVSIFVKLFLILVLHLRQFFIVRIFVKRATDLQTREEFTLQWSKKMECKVGFISHRPGKTKPSLWDIGTCKQKLVSEYLLYFENLAYNDTLYSNSRKIFQGFETCKDIFTLRNGTGKTNTIGIATYSQRHSASVGCSR